MGGVEELGDGALLFNVSRKISAVHDDVGEVKLLWRELCCSGFCKSLMDRMQRQKTARKLKVRVYPKIVRMRKDIYVWGRCNSSSDARTKSYFWLQI